MRMVQGDRLEASSLSLDRCRKSHRGSRGCSNGETLDELPPTHLSILKILKQSGNDRFHVPSRSEVVWSKTMFYYLVGGGADHGP